jgi:hypothetical protein
MLIDEYKNCRGILSHELPDPGQVMIIMLSYKIRQVYDSHGGFETGMQCSMDKRRLVFTMEICKRYPKGYLYLHKGLEIMLNFFFYLTVY